MRRLARLPVIDHPTMGPVRVARTPRARLLGLVLLRRAPEEPLLLERCRSVHTFGMRFPLHLVWLDARGRVLRVDRHVPPRRVRTCRRARAVVEVSAAASGRARA